MQGQLLGESANSANPPRMLAKVFIRGVTEGPGFTNRWVPLEYVTKGKPWQTEIDMWDLQLRLVGGTYNSHNWTNSSLPDTTLLGTTITRLITAFRQSPPALLGGKLSQFIDKYNIIVISNAILQGIKEAGLYQVMKDGNFDAQSMITKATHRIDSANASHKGGVYARFRVSSATVTYWLPKTKYLYIGKTNDFGARFGTHPSTRNTYGDLTRNSDVLCMIAVCILPPTSESGLYYLAEQIFVCLLQTYKRFLLDCQPNVVIPGSISMSGPAQYFDDVSKEVFKMTDWTGGVSRPGFNVTEGANISSPLTEWAYSSDKHLFIRTDVDIKDGNTGTTVPMAFFQRAKQLVAGPAKSNAQPRVRVFKRGAEFATGTPSMVLSYPINGKTLADYPLPGTPYQLVFEVRKDGTPHPHGYARLPEIGCFVNWGQANSFAARIEWEYPANSGKWRSRYLQAGHPTGEHLFGRVNNVPGALNTYAKSLSFLQWLVGARPNHNHAWIPTAVGSAHVLMAEFNMLNQSILFRPPGSSEQIVMLSGARRSDNDIKAQMRLPGYDLENVDGEFGDFNPGKYPRSKVCDTCALIPSNLGNLGITDTGCVQVGNSRVCTTCVHFGRPCCSWSSNFSDLQGQNLPHGDFIRQQNITSALLFQPIQEIPESMQSFSQDLRPLDNAEVPEDDGSEVGSEDEWNEGDDDNI
jgi:hypothetical protein